MRAEVKVPGARGGRWYRTRSGRIRYGKPPEGASGTGAVWQYEVGGTLFDLPSRAIDAAIEWWATGSGTNPVPEPIATWTDEDIAGAAEYLSVRPRWEGDVEAQKETEHIRRLLAQRVRELQREQPDYRPGAQEAGKPTTNGTKPPRWVAEAARLVRKLRDEAEYVAEVGAETAGYGDDTDQAVEALRGAADWFEEAIREYKRGNKRRALDALKTAYTGYSDLGGENAAISEALERAREEL